MEFDRFLKIRELEFFTGNPSVSLFSGCLILKNVDFLENSKSLLLAIISIPDCFELSFIIQKFNDFMPFIVQIMVIKTEFPNYYSLILRFDNICWRDNFAKIFNMKNIEIFDSEKFVLKIVQKFSMTDDNQIEFLNPLEIFSIHPKQMNSSIKNKDFNSCPICLETYEDIKDDTVI
jgi:hypothetical protein